MSAFQKWLGGCAPGMEQTMNPGPGHRPPQADRRNERLPACSGRIRKDGNATKCTHRARLSVDPGCPMRARHSPGRSARAVAWMAARPPTKQEYPASNRALQPADSHRKKETRSFWPALAPPEAPKSGTSCRTQHPKRHTRAHGPACKNAHGSPGCGSTVSFGVRTACFGL